MSTIDVQPVANEAEGGNTVQFDLSLRIKVLDLATGKPITRAIATKPVIEPKVLDALGKHPMQVTIKRSCDIEFSNNGTIYTPTLKLPGLKTFVPEPTDASPVTKLKATWQCTPEVFFTRAGRLTTDKGTQFQRVDDSEARYVCIRWKDNSGEVVSAAERVLATDHNGILEIPLNGDHWLSGAKAEVEFRDYRILEAEGDFDAELGHDKFDVTLSGTPTANDWKISPKDSPETSQSLEQSLELELSSFSGIAQRIQKQVWGPARDDDDVDVTLWAVRKIETYEDETGEDVVKTISTPLGTSTRTVRGIVVHYNSGYEVKERRKGKTIQCRDVFDQADRSVLRDNTILGAARLPMVILEKFYPSRKVGYHYHITRDGAVWFVVSEDDKTQHAAASREPSKTKCRVGKGKDAVEHTHDRSSADNWLNGDYIGISLIGYHADASFYFTDRQVWSLDRLIENIRSRYDDVVWHRILGHDEVREAYNDWAEDNDKDQSAAKHDPGAAMTGGGMNALRGRHYES